MAQDYDTGPAFPPFGARTETGTLFGQTMGLAVAPTVSYLADVYVVLIFVSIPGGLVVYAVFGLAVFAGLVMYDFRRMRVTNEIHSAPLLAARSSSTSSTSSSSSSGSSVGGAVDGPHRATDAAPILMAGGMTHDDECD